MRVGGGLALPPRARVSTLRLAPSLVSPPPIDGRRLSAFSQVVPRLATSVAPGCRCWRFVVRCWARPEWEKLKAESESLKGSKRADKRR
jgi:hypothetical protein